MDQILLPILRELEATNHLVEKEMWLKAGHISQFISLEFEAPEKYFYPAQLILAAKTFGCEKDQVHALAAVVQFINIATRVSSYNEPPAFPVLVGDYLYTKFFSFLCRYGGLEWLAPLSHAICMIHEAGVIRQQWRTQGTGSEKDQLAILEKETALLAGEAAAIGSWLAGQNGATTEMVRKAGFNLGMGWAVGKEPSLAHLVPCYLSNAKEVLTHLPQNAFSQAWLDMLIWLGRITESSGQLRGALA